MDLESVKSEHELRQEIIRRQRIIDEITIEARTLIAALDGCRMGRLSDGLRAAIAKAINA